MVSLMLKFRDTKPKFIADLISVSASSKNLILIALSWFYGQAPVRKSVLWSFSMPQRKKRWSES